MEVLHRFGTDLFCISLLHYGLLCMIIQSIYLSRMDLHTICIIFVYGRMSITVENIIQAVILRLFNECEFIEFYFESFVL